MVNSGTVNSDASAIDGLFNSYESNTSSLKSSSVWQGESKNNAMNLFSTFVSDFKGQIKDQMSEFASAIDEYNKYKQVKEELENTKQAQANAAPENKSSYNSTISSLETQLKTLKSTIESKLSSVSSKKVDVQTTSLNVDTGSYSVGNFVYYSQGDYRGVRYGSSTISKGGCGPTSMAMVVSTLLGKKVDPVEMAKFSVANGCRYSGGTTWGLFPKAAQKYGIDCEKVSVSSSNMMKYLGENKYIICSMSKGHFTNGGHFIVLKKGANGKVEVADPNNNKHSGTWDASLVARECKGMWALGGGNAKTEQKAVSF